MNKRTEVMVLVICYNHEKYIAQCLDGIFMQQCDFPFRVCLFDDLSTDRSMEVVRTYQEKYGEQLIVIQPETNQYKEGIYSGAMRAFLEVNDAKYMAFCEGDDYWTDCEKLQRQHDAMEQRKNAALCICDVNLEDVENGNSLGIVPGGVSAGWSREEILYRVLDYSLSFRLNGFMVRTDVFKQTDIHNDYWNYWAQDNAIVSYCLLHGDCVYVDRCMTTKRMNNEGSFSYMSNIGANIKQQIGVFEADIRWMQEFSRIAGAEYESLAAFYITYRKIKLYYLRHNEFDKNRWVSNVNGKMYVHELGRKINRWYVRLVGILYHNNECAFVKQRAKWMRKEWDRLQGSI